MTTIKWSAEDIQTLRPEWSVEECEVFLQAKFEYFKQASISQGWEIWETLLEEESK
jgi:hypothetical protein